MNRDSLIILLFVSFSNVTYSGFWGNHLDTGQVESGWMIQESLSPSGNIVTTAALLLFIIFVFIVVDLNRKRKDDMEITRKSKDRTKGIGPGRQSDVESTTTENRVKNTGRVRGMLVNGAWAIFAFVVFAVISLMNRGIV